MWDCLARALRSWVVTSHWSRTSTVSGRCGRSARSTRLTRGRVIGGINVQANYQPIAEGIVVIVSVFLSRFQ